MAIRWFSRVEEIENDERGRVFAWAKDKRVWMHLTAFLFFSVLIHGSGFYLFKVVYPSPVRVEVDPDAITVLKEGDPAARTVLQRLADRTLFLSPPSEESGARVRLDAHEIRFTPAFQRTELSLVIPESMRAGPGEPEPLPDLGPGAAAKTVPLKLDPALADRGLAPWSILRDFLSLADRLPPMRFSIAVAPGGEVRVTEVEAELEEAEKRELAEVVESTLRFVPGTGAQEGWIELGGG